MSANNGFPCRNCHGTDWNKSGKCRKCKSDHDKAYRENNHEKVLARKRQYRLENLGKVRDGYLRWLTNNREKKAETDKQWAAANRDKVRANHRRWRSQNQNKAKIYAITLRWRENNRDRENELHREWARNNHELVIIKNHNRRAKLRNSPGKYTPQEWRELLFRFGNKCLCCGREDAPLTVDHVVPLSRGGTNDINNLQPLCLTCNDRKGAKTIDYRYTVMDQ